MRSPFKFLDAFTLKDKDAFFGRDQEMEDLYTLVFKTPLILVYGLSGTGKTSLVQCGLASKFDGPDWYPMFIRRNENINTSVHTLMQSALGDLTKDKLVENVSLLLRKTLRPVYLLFDQLEELFILGKEDEQNAFMQSIRELLDAQLPAKIVFIMREEYIGQMYHFEKIIPELFDHRFRVEPMGPTKVKNVIRSSFDRFNIHLTEPVEPLLDMMVDNISDPRTGITLPYLQVYLDMLYRDKYRKQFGTTSQSGFPRIDITAEDIASIGRIDNVLERFLEDQIRELQRELKTDFKTLPPNVVQSVLDIFVSDEGTKRPLHYRQEGDMLVLTDEIAGSLHAIPQAALTFMLESLQQDRILRRREEYMELAHDSLALVIDSRRSESQRQLQNVRKRLLNAFEEYQKTGAFLNQKQLATFEEYLPHLGLSGEITAFLDLCENEVIRKAKEEQERLQQETQIAQQKKLARTRGVWLTIAIILGALAGFMAFQASTRADQLEVKRTELEAEYQTSNRQRDSIANIIVQVDQQFGRMDSIVTGKLAYSELVKSVITLKSMVRNDSINTLDMGKNYITAIRVFTSGNPNVMSPELSSVDSVIQGSTASLVLHLNTPSPEEWIQIKLMSADGKVLGEPHYDKIQRGPDGTKWYTRSQALTRTGVYVVGIYNSLGYEVGRHRFRMVAGEADEVSMTEQSVFKTMASGTLDKPGRETNTFKVGQMIHYWFRINSPKENERITVVLIDSHNKTIWTDEFRTAVNTATGFRGWKYHGARTAGTYNIKLLNSEGQELAGHTIVVE